MRVSAKPAPAISAEELKLALAEFARSDVGRLFMRQLEADTIQLPTYRRWGVKERDLPNLSAPKDETLFAAWREGQNDVVRKIQVLFGVER